MTAVPDWDRVKEVFQEALDLPADERMLRVRQRCADDLALRAEVESLLETHAQAGSFAERPAEELLGALSLSSNSEPVNLMGRTLPSGTRLGVYEIQSLLGTGGMGEVYQARDTRLDRTVAIKVLLKGAGADEHARERFEHEARAVAALSHPNICTLHDIGHQDGIDFLVMEHLSGETLAARLANGPMPPEQAIVIATQIASALDAAHRAGVVHRDLKPANIFLVRSARGSGVFTAKLLDFGLAKACQPTIAGIALPDSPVTDLTESGAIVGTARYMAPEQVEGKAVDARTDIFAFGTMLYEVLSGRRAFNGESEADVRAAIVDEEPTPLSTMQPLLPGNLTRIVSTCLAKDPDDRWQTARDLLRALTWFGDGHATPAPAAVPRRARAVLLAATAIVLTGIAAGAMLSGRFRPAVTGSISFAIYPPEGSRFPRGTAEMAMSPDGRRLVFVAVSQPDTRRLWMREFDTVSARVIDGTEGAAYPFWSPDGRSIAFFTPGKLKRIPATGGLPQAVCDVLMIGRGGTWNRDGTILFAQVSGPIQRVPDTGGKPTPVTVPDPSHGERVHEWPVFLPDGRRFLYVARSDVPGNTGLYQAALDSTQRDRLPPLTSNVALVGRHLLALGNRSLLAHAYDSDRARVIGAPITAAGRMDYDSLQRSAGAFSAAPDGALAYRSADPDSRLIWFDRTGQEVGGSGWSDYHHPWLAPDETRVAVERTDASTGRHTIWILDVLRGVTSRLVADASGAHLPVWSPDGARVLYSSNRLGGVDLYWMRADGAGGEQLVLSSPARVRHVATDWSLDGRYVLFDVRPYEDSDLWILSLVPGEKPQPFLHSQRSQEVQGRFSPDTRWVAYASDESGSFEVYVRRFPSADGKWQVSTHGGAQPQWRRDGKELFYLAPDGKLMVAGVTSAGSHFETGTPSRLLDTGITGAFIDRRNQYVATRDGQRFLVNVSAEDTNPTPITVVLNWAANQNR